MAAAAVAVVLGNLEKPVTVMPVVPMAEMVLQYLYPDNRNFMPAAAHQGHTPVRKDLADLVVEAMVSLLHKHKMEHQIQAAAAAAAHQTRVLQDL
jgi:hypothetical protein